METIDFRSHLPPYRSLLSPNTSYDYRTHSLIPIEKNNTLQELIINRATLPKTRFKMKYKSLIDDVSRKTSILSPLNAGATTNNNTKGCKTSCRKITINHLPEEILQRIFGLVNDRNSYINCLMVCKRFYLLIKPLLYENLTFTSSYRFGQFITYLRLNKSVGEYVKLVDLSHISNGTDVDNLNEILDEINGQSSEETNELNEKEVLAGWRDWKFKTNMLYKYRNVSSKRTRCNSTRSVRKGGASPLVKLNKFSKTFISLKPKKFRKLNTSNKEASHEVRDLVSGQRRSSHPLMNKFLLGYAAFNDIPVGYVIHLVRLCPNMVSLSLGNLSLSTDYQIDRALVHKFRGADTMNAFPRETIKLIKKIEGANERQKKAELLKHAPERNCYPPSSDNDDPQIWKDKLCQTKYLECQSLEKYEIDTNATGESLPVDQSVTLYNLMKPTFKYNSLLSPKSPEVDNLNDQYSDQSCVFLSDLCLKSWDPSDLTRITGAHVLEECLKKQKKAEENKYHKCNKFKFINLSSMSWLTRKDIHWFLSNLVELSDVICHGESERHRGFPGKSRPIKQDIVIDLSDSGMHKNLPWARKIDLKREKDCDLVSKIINDDLATSSNEVARRNTIRRNAIGENYLH